MAYPGSTIPTLGHQPATVAFIDNQLPKYHPAFVNPPARYDPMSEQYVPNSQALVPRLNNGALMPQGASATPPADNMPFPRPSWTDTSAMGFWTGIFPEAIAQFRSTTEPKGRSKTAYNIRDKHDWDMIYDTLEAARIKYRNEGGPVGWVRKVRRKVADNIGPGAEAAKIASKVVPENPYATPVLGAVEVLLDAVKTAATVRNRVLTGFDGLIPIFADVELFLGDFRGDVNIRNASVALTVTVLDAIERAIGFFISNEFLKGGKALFTGGDYEKNLLQSLDMIKEKSTSLMEEALKSHIHAVHMFSQETRNLQKQVLEKQQELADGLLNSFNHLLVDHVRLRDQLNAAQQEVVYLRVRNGILEQSRLTPPPPEVPVVEWYVNEEALRRVLDTADVDLADAAFVADKKAQLPARQRVQAEQIINAPLFREWIVSPRSAKLLVQWDFRPPKTTAGVSPLSVFCAAMAHALRAKPRFVSALWFCGRHVDVDVNTDAGIAERESARALLGAQPMLASLIDQLLRQHAFDTRQLHRDVHLAALQAGGLDERLRLLSWLVRRLPETTTLVCIVDGVVLFERDEFEDEALRVFSSLLSLAADPSVPAAVKVLFTSTPGTGIVRAAFEEEDLILNVDGLPRLVWAPNDERMVRELEGEPSEAVVELDS